MADHFVAEKDILFLRPSADIVDHQRRAFCGLAIGYYSNVSDATAQVPSDHVSRGEIRELLGHRHRPTLAPEVGHQV